MSERTCSICSSPARLAFVERKRAMGYGATRIESASRTPEARERGITPIKCETVMRHLQHASPVDPSPPSDDEVREVFTEQAVVRASESAARVLDPDPVPDPVPEPDPVPVPTPEPKGGEAMGPREDIASLVADEGVKRLKDGSLRVTTQHALQAQQMLDRREERRKDRELAITVARMLTSRLPPDRVIRTVSPGVDLIEPGS